jgi:hypothetical protein
MAEDKERISQSPSYVLVNRQLQDLVRTQNTAIVKLQCMVGDISFLGILLNRNVLDKMSII